ncbi:hypothetical protein [Mesorhizobium sp. 1B3]|uniref:hypothetical protein n=1 Tax=Mesorhizobium sp. 1B3 TaxID=3243599 RepID=UPI003D99AC27
MFQMAIIAVCIDENRRSRRLLDAPRVAARDNYSWSVWTRFRASGNIGWPPTLTSPSTVKASKFKG